MQRIPAPWDLEAEVFTALPEALRHKGEPSPWAKMNRPGMQMHSFLEGPGFDKDGNLWLVDIPYGRIFRVSPQGDWTLAHSYDGNPHCLAHLPDGGIAFTDRLGGIMRLDPKTGAVTPICQQVNFENFRALSDVAVAPNGDLWFTDPGRSSPSDPTGRVLRLRQGETRPEIVLANVPYANSVALDKAGRTVYISVTRANCIWRLFADAPDPVYPMVSTFAHLAGGNGPDGLAVDSRGRLAIAQSQCGRAYLFEPNGDMIARIRTPTGAWTTAVAFGPDENWLYIIESQSATILRIDLSQLPG